MCEIVAECLEAAEVDRECVVVLAIVPFADADLVAPSGLLESTEAERARPDAAIVVEEMLADLPSLPPARC